MLATKNIRQVSRFIDAAWIEMIVDALGPKCFVIISMHIKDSQEIKIPPSIAIQSSCTSVLFASRFIETTLITKRVTTVAGTVLRSIFDSLYNLFIEATLLSLPTYIFI